MTIRYYVHAHQVGSTHGKKLVIGVTTQSDASLAALGDEYEVPRRLANQIRSRLNRGLSTLVLGNGVMFS